MKAGRTGCVCVWEPQRQGHAGRGWRQGRTQDIILSVFPYLSPETSCLLRAQLLPREGQCFIFLLDSPPFHIKVLSTRWEEIGSSIKVQNQQTLAPKSAGNSPCDLEESFISHFLQLWNRCDQIITNLQTGFTTLWVHNRDHWIKLGEKL